MMHWSSSYVGTPFGESSGEVTCWSLVCSVYRSMLGIDLPEYGEISARDLVRVARRMEEGKNDGWLEVHEPEEFDVVMMRSGRGGATVVHVGVMVSRTHMMHVELATATVVVPITHFSVSGRILGFRRKIK